MEQIKEEIKKLAKDKDMRDLLHEYLEQAKTDPSVKPYVFACWELIMERD